MCSSRDRALLQQQVTAFPKCYEILNHIACDMKPSESTIMEIRRMAIELMRLQCFGKSGKKMGLITN